MYNSQQDSGYLSILYAIGLKPLQGWETSVRNGHIKRVTDVDIQSAAIEIIGANVSNNFIAHPIDNNMSLDDKNIRRKFIASNFQSYIRVKPTICSLPMKLEDGWNQIHLDLVDFTKRAFGTNYVETAKVQIHANIRIRRIYFTNLPVNSKKLPPEYKAFAAIQEDSANEKYGGIIEEN